MIKLTSLALTAALGVAGVACSLPAAACPTVAVGVAGPAVAVVTPVGYYPGYYRPYYGHDRDWRRDRYWHRDGWRDDRFHHHWR